jgi:hypothetical protein
MASEIWKPVVGYEGLYEVSDLGRVRNASGKVLRDRILWTGYNRAALCKNGTRKCTPVHRLVAAAFIGPRPDGHEVNHINGIRADNRPENLEYVTRRQNMAHKKVTGTWQGRENNPRAILSNRQVEEIRRRHGAGERAIVMAREYGVHKNTIFALLRGETWQAAA